MGELLSNSSLVVGYVSLFFRFQFYKIMSWTNSPYQINSYQDVPFFSNRQEFMNFYDYLDDPSISKLSQNVTHHTQNLKECNQNSQTQREYQPKQINLKNRKANVIQCGVKTVIGIQKCRKGRKGELKNIPQILTREAARFLKILADSHALSNLLETKTEINDIYQRRRQGEYFLQCCQHKQIKSQIIAFCCDSEFVKGIMMTSRLDFQRKIEVLKNMNVLQKILQNKG